MIIAATLCNSPRADTPSPKRQLRPSRLALFFSPANPSGFSSVDVQQLAALSGGKVLGNQADLRAVLSGHAATPGETVVHRSPIWDHPLIWFLIVLMLSIEWIIRRRIGLA